MPTRAWRNSCFSKVQPPVRQAMPIAKENTWDKGESPSPDSESRKSGLDRIRIVGGKRLNGTIPVSGAKNSALKLMCAALLTDETLYLDNMPNGLRDIRSQTDLVQHLGGTVSVERDLMAINASQITTREAPYDLVRKMRTSILVLGPLL